MIPTTPRRPSASSEGGCLPAVLLLVSIVPLSVIHAATLMKLWEWFIADPFGVREIGLPLAIGLTALITAVTVRPDESQSEGDLWASLVKVWVWRLCVTALLLGEGLIVSRWV